MKGSKPDTDKQPNGSHHGSGGSKHANGPPGENHRWLRSALKNASEVIKVVDPDGTLCYASPAFGRMLGYDPEDAVGKMNVFDHVHPVDLPRFLQETEKAHSGGGVATNRARVSLPPRRRLVAVGGVGGHLPARRPRGGGPGDSKRRFKKALEGQLDTAPPETGSEPETLCSELPGGEVRLRLLPWRDPTMPGGRVVVAEPVLAAFDNSEQRIRRAAQQRDLGQENAGQAPPLP